MRLLERLLDPSCPTNEVDHRALEFGRAVRLPRVEARQANPRPADQGLPDRRRRWSGGELDRKAEAREDVRSEKGRYGLDRKAVPASRPRYHVRSGCGLVLRPESSITSLRPPDCPACPELRSLLSLQA